MTRFGYSLMCEEHHPNALLERGRRAEELGFDFLTVSDHFHPWLHSQRHSPYAWSLLGGLAATTERVDLVSFVTCPTGAWESAAGGGGPRYGQLAVCVHPDEAEARRIAHERFRFTAPGWKVMAELPNPINFEAATELVREEDVAERIPCGPDPGPVRELVQQWVDAGFDHVAIVPVGDDPEPFLQMWEQELRPQLAPA